MALNYIQQIIVVAIIAVCIALLMAFLVYNYTGWKVFTMSKGENFQITDLDPALVSSLKFKDCVFTAIGTDGNIKEYTVSSALNKMVAAYEGNSNPNYVFKLDDPGLSIYSFQIPGFNNDKTNPPDETIWGDSASTTLILTGYYKLLN